MAEGSSSLPIRTFRITDELWRQYGETVGDRSADLRAYIEWRIANPDARLSRRRRPQTPAAE